MAKKAPARKAACRRAQEGREAAHGVQRPGGRPEEEGGPEEEGRPAKARGRSAAARKAATRRPQDGLARPSRSKSRPKPQAQGSQPATAVQAERPAKPKPGKARRARGGNGDERTLAQTPETGRSVSGRTNPMPTRRSTGTPAGAAALALAPGLDRARRQLREVEEHVPGPPSSLDLDRYSVRRTHRPPRARSRPARAHRNQPGHDGRRRGRRLGRRLRGGRRSAGRRQPHARSGSRGRHRQGAGRRVRGQRGAEGRRQNRRARSSIAGSSTRRRPRTTRIGTDGTRAHPSCPASAQLPASSRSAS